MTQSNLHMTSNRKVMTYVGLLLQAYFLVVVIPNVTVSLSSVFDIIESISYIDQETHIALLELERVLDQLFFVVNRIKYILFVIFILNSVLFLLLMTNRLSHKQSKYVYVYQGIIGLLFLLIQPIVGVLYIFSGFGGFQSTEIHSINIREGI